MLFKLIGGAIVIISTYILGCIKAFEYHNRAKYLQSMHNCISQLENEIRYTQTPVSLAFKKISCNAHHVIKKIFDSAASKSEEATGMLLSNIWEDTVANCSGDLFDEDVELFLSFEACLGSSDVEGQIKSINLYNDKIKSAMYAAEEQSQQNKKMFRSTGLYLGILLAILFI